MRIRTLIAVSDACSRQVLHGGVAADPEVNLVGDCSTISQITMALSDHCPSLLFLDIQMPELDCLALVKAIGAEPLLATIFVVPPGDYAMQTFAGQAFGYLTRPITDDRLSAVLRDAKGYISGRRLLENDPNRLFKLLSMKSGLSNEDRILIREEGRFLFLRTEEIDWIQANANYVRIHVGGTSYLHRQTITSLERHLDPARFLRIHRSAIVNIDKIRELRPWPTGEYVVLMRNGKELTLSRSYRTRLPFFVSEGCSIGSAKESPLPSIREFCHQVRASKGATSDGRVLAFADHALDVEASQKNSSADSSWQGKDDDGEQQGIRATKQPLNIDARSYESGPNSLGTFQS
jgi:two-component system LytT family response regulator